MKSQLFQCAVVAAAAASVLAAVPAIAAPVELKMLSPTPARSPYNGKVLAPWAKKVTADSKGALDIKFMTGMSLATHRNIYDRVTTNVIPIGWGLQSSVRGQFPQSEVAELPLLYKQPMAGSMAMWHLFESGLIADEYKNIKVLTIFAFPQNELHATQPIPNLEAVQGMKVGAFGHIRLELVKALGATPIAVPPPGLYQATSRGLITGMIMGYSAFPAYKLQEVTKYHLEIPLGGNAGMVFMNRQVYEKLPAAAKKAINANVGEAFSRSWARTAAGLYAFGKKISQKRPGSVFGEVSDADQARWSQRFKPVYDTWAKAAPNADKVLAAFKAEIAKAQMKR